ncbi:hypothetical protein B566_EDAN006450, partial [Ephemera danica]
MLHFIATPLESYIACFNFVMCPTADT